MSKLEDFQRTRSRLKSKLELIDWQLNSILKDPQLKNSNDVIELQIERLKVMDKLRYLRPSNYQDISYRQKVLEIFPHWAAQYIPDNLNLLFHATNLANTQRILDSGRITSGKDRWTIRTSGDGKGEISISTKNSLSVSLSGHMDLIAQEYHLPAGCLFALHVSKEKYQTAQKDTHTQNIQLRQNPKQLYAIITTPENLNRVKWWVQKNGFMPSIVYDFQAFQEKIEKENLLFSWVERSYQK